MSTQGHCQSAIWPHQPATPQLCKQNLFASYFAHQSGKDTTSHDTCTGEPPIGPIMPVYEINTRADLAAFYPYLRYLYDEDEMFHILKLQHTEENCAPGSEPMLSRAYPQLHLIYLHPRLATNMRQLLAHLNRISTPLDPDDTRNFIRCLMMCPLCGRVYNDQTNRRSRSS